MRQKIFADKATFLAALTNPTCDENFTSFSQGVKPFGSANFCTSTGFLFTATAGNVQNLIGVGGASGQPLDNALAVGGHASLTLTLTDGPVAIGGNFWLLDDSLMVAGGLIQVALSDGTTTSITTLTKTGYLGFISASPLTSLTLTPPSVESIAVDNITIGFGPISPVPEPNSMAMIVLATGAFFAIRRSTRKLRMYRVNTPAKPSPAVDRGAALRYSCLHEKTCLFAAVEPRVVAG